MVLRSWYFYVWYSGHVSGWGPAEEPAALHWVSAEPWASLLTRSWPAASQGYVCSHAKLSRRVPKHPSAQCHPGSPQHHHTHTRAEHRWVTAWSDLLGHSGVDQYRRKWSQEFCWFTVNLNWYITGHGQALLWQVNNLTGIGVSLKYRAIFKSKVNVI